MPPRLTLQQIAEQYVPGGKYGTNTGKWRVDVLPRPTKRKPLPPKPSGTPDDIFWQQINRYAGLLGNQQQQTMNQMLEESRRRSMGQQAAMGGFGAALQGYASDLWGQTAQGYKEAGAAQQSLAAGLGGQMAQGLSAAHSRQAELAAGLGYTGPDQITDTGAAQAQIASEGGARTGEMMGQVGTAWGGYGATRPDTIGFMTGQNQMQLAREEIGAEKDIRLEFAKLAMDNPKTAAELWQAMRSNQREDVSTSLAAQTLQQNIAMQQAKLRQQYASLRQRATTASEKLKLDQWYKQQQIALNQQGLAVSQQRANAYEFGQHKPPRPTTVKGYAAGTYQEKIGKAMDDVPTLLSKIPSSGKLGVDRQTAIKSAFATLWPQIQPYISAANQERAKKLLRVRIGTVVAHWTPKAAGSGYGAGGGW